MLSEKIAKAHGDALEIIETLKRDVAEARRQRDEAIAELRIGSANARGEMADLLARIDALQGETYPLDLVRIDVDQFSRNVLNFVMASIKDGTFEAWLKRNEADEPKTIGA